MEHDLLKFITCGSVDDGKSTLIGHLLYDAKMLFADQKKALELESKVGSADGELDYSLLLDGLMEERQEGITIDVAYRYFSTAKRSFIVADTPGHEEYTRNMAVGASFADLSIILVDATKGVLIQTRRHARICKLMGIDYFVFAVNKMDLAGYDQHCFENIEQDISVLCQELGIESAIVIPVSAKVGDNITSSSGRMQWYYLDYGANNRNTSIVKRLNKNIGLSLMDYLEQVRIDKASEHGFSLPVQRVCRPNYTFRGFQGQVESGELHVGDAITVLPSEQVAHVKQLLNAGSRTDSIKVGQAVTVCLDKEIDISRGCVLVKDADIEVGNLFMATILWMDKQPLASGRTFYIKLGTTQVLATVMNVKYRINVSTGAQEVASSIQKNDLALCQIALSEKIAFDRFSRHKTLGSFLLIDRVTFNTSACGVIAHKLERDGNIYWHEMDIDRRYRAQRLSQKPLTIWFTGLSGSGKSTLANALEKKLNLSGFYTMLLDGDNTRFGLNKDLGFSVSDRAENIRRLSEVAKLMNDAGLIVLTAFISPFESDRQSACDIIGKDNFIEIYVNTPLEECERRDVKQLYAKARRGELANFTGISSPYEVPRAPFFTIDSSRNLEDCIEKVYKAIIGRVQEQ